MNEKGNICVLRAARISSLRSFKNLNWYRCLFRRQKNKCNAAFWGNNNNMRDQM